MRPDADPFGVRRILIAGNATLVLMGAVCLAGEPCCPDFQAGPLFDVGFNFGASALADLDGDGYLDLTTGKVIFLGDGAGGFSEETFELPLDDPAPFDILPADFDADGRTDLVICPPRGEVVRFLFALETSGPGRPAFSDPQDVPAVMGVWHLGIADFNEDGRPDVVAVSAAESFVTLLLNEGERSFRSESVGPLHTSGHPLAVGDFDGDGHADVAVGVAAEIDLLFGNGDGTFRKPVPSVTGGVFAHRYRAGDLDGDGRSDLIVIGAQYVLVFLGRGIDPQEGLPTLPSEVYQLLWLEGVGRFVELADVAGDGTRDDIVALWVDPQDRSSRLDVFRGQPDGQGRIAFAQCESFGAPIPGSSAVLAVGDLDGDGTDDIVLTAEGDELGQVWRNLGSCLVPPVRRGDATGDGRLDLADPIAILNHLHAGGVLACPAAAEVNGDDRLDLADPIYLLSHLFASGNAPVGSEYVDCGPRKAAS
ncbi:MAG: VCBS repeat-containing protein [Planctomycetes bacterium]|nr:VCBS repeat-containing protein [Planctomycetota bacterium]